MTKNELQDPHFYYRIVTSISSPRLTSLRLTSARFNSPRFESPRFTSPRFTSPRFASPCHTSPRFQVLGCLPFTKTIQLEISGINMKQLNAMLRKTESL